MRAALLVIVLMLALVQGVAAWNITELTIDPKGPVTPRIPVVVTGSIDFVPSSDKTCVSSHEFGFSTLLQNAEWYFVLDIDGTEKILPAVSGNSTTLSGWLLSYPGGTEESLRFRLKGTTPSVSQTSNRTILLVRETDENGSPVPGTRHEYTMVVVNTRWDPKPGHPEISDLQVLRSHIDEKSMLGVNTTLAEVKYAEADAMIKSATGRPSSQYLLAYADFDAAQKAIDEGEVALDRAWAEKEIADVQKKVDELDALIGWFRGNESTADDANLPSIVMRREIAAVFLTTAKDEMVNGRYEEARRKAHEAYEKANESFMEGDRFDRIQPVNPLPLYGIAVIILILLIAGILWWRKRRAWWLE